MILRSVHLEHWRCIRKLDLTGLPDGIVVLHGPNRTGKSSLVRALRCCLFDADHNTNSRDIKASQPWNGAGPPRVAIEFALGGADYRLTKVFSPRKDGLALLEQKNGVGWKVLEKAPKEAARKARELLGAADSRSGLNQLLWLDQGDVALPDAGKLDASLQQRLTEVLGCLVTGRDHAFQTEIAQRCAQWFTERGGYRKGSRVVHWEERLADAQQRLGEEQAKFQVKEQTILKVEEFQEQEPQFERSVKEAEKDVQLLDEERSRALERRRQQTEAETALQSATQALQAAEATLTACRDARQRHRERETAAEQAQGALTFAQEQRDRLEKQHAARAADVQLIRQGEKDQFHAHEEIEDRRLLVELHQGIGQIDEMLGHVQHLEEEAAALEERSRGVAAPDRAALDQLRKTRARLETVRALVQASALTVRIVPTHPGQVRLTLDDGSAGTVELTAQEEQSWQVRQRATLDIPEVGVIAVGRSQQDLDLERCARELAELERSFADAVKGFGLDPADADCLDRLAERRIEREAWTKRLQEVRRDIQQRVPEGRGALEARRAMLQTQRQAVLERRSDLRDWQPDAAQVAALATKYASSAAGLERDRQAAEQAEQLAQDSLREADAALQKAKLRRAETEAAVRTGLEELDRLGDETTLAAAVEGARTATTAAAQRVADTRLTEAELTIEERWTTARQALEQRRQRLHDVQRQIVHLSGILQGHEGLHLRLADAEAELQAARHNLDREKLEADAHRKLRDLFEECRESQVQQVMGPIAGRVLEWARMLGLHEYQEVRFADRFLPEGIRLRNGAEALATIDDESYGTGEQLSLLVRLALGGILARDEPVTAILDDPLAHADPVKHRRVLDVLRLAARGNTALSPPAGRLQIIILTCHPERFDHLPGAKSIELASLIEREV